MLVVGAGQNQYNLYNSLRFRSSASAYLSRTPASTTNQKTWTWSGWVKRGALGSEQAIFATADTGVATGSIFIFRFTSTDIMRVVQTNSGGAVVLQFDTTAVFRDPGAWYHVVLYMDTTQATNSNGIRIYVNGTLQAGTYAAYAQNTNTSVNSTSFAMYHGRYGAISPTAYLDGYLTEINFIDGQALPPTAFAAINPATGVGAPIKYTGTYGTNGFYLPFTDTSALTTSSNVGLGKDFSGNGNYWTTNNISITAGTTYDAMTDVPTNTNPTVANYAVLNPLWKASNLTLAGANLNITSTGSGGTAISTMAMESGKYYCEVTVNTGSDATIIGICNNSFNPTTTTLTSAGSVGYYGNNGDKFVNGTQSAYGASYTTGNIIGIALDITAGTVTFYKNNTSQGAITHGLTGPFYYATSDVSSGSNIDQSWNFGQRPFTYTPPTGFVRLNTFNLPTPTILQGNKYMDATLYTGTAATLNVVNAGQFKPDFVWIKARSYAENHLDYDSVRGINQRLYPNLTNAESTATNQFNSFNSNGFTLGADPAQQANTLNATYVAWQWQAGQGTTSSNTSGSITSTVSVNTTAGFSVVTYTGTGSNATVGHGLGVAPKMVIVKRRDNGVGATNWWVYHVRLNAGVNPQQWAISLNQTAAQVGSTAVWNDTAPTSTVFTVGTSSEINGSGGTFVAYVFAEIAGFSAFGSYTGNGSSDGPMVYCNFAPKFILIKRTDTSGTSWVMYDSARATYNVVDKLLLADSSGAEVTATSLDFLSNGFKLRSTDGSRNASGGTYIYAAFAENPFKNALAR